KDITADKVITKDAAEEAAKDEVKATPPETTTTAAPDAPAPPPASPWKYTLGVGVNGAMTRSTNVVGAVDGTSAQVGAIVDGTANYVHEQHNWENLLKLTESFTRSPAIPSFLKSADELRLQSTYIYKLKAVPWLGPYARGLGTTSLFRGYEVRGADTTIIRNFSDGTSETLLKPAGNKYGTTKPFEPTLLRESIGMFTNPIALPEFTLKTRLGAAMQHILTREGFAVSDDSATPEVEYKQLVDSTQAGAELGIEMLGKAAENLTYTASADFFYPLYESTDSPQDGLENLQTNIAAKLSVRLSKFFSLDYILSLKRIPIIVDEWQVQNGLLVSCNYTIF
ncbi:MAG TPA: DUF3078 domain-containing protein, partial [Myxococcota bacterium]|nr:DUF3078 domain-containing protein [Myxococcota bacterium]